MKCGRLWANGGEKFGSGWPSSVPAGASWPGCWAGVIRPRPGAYGWRPPRYRRHCWYFTDLWEAYVGVLPRWHHRRCPKGSGGTNIVEALNCSLRQRCGVLVRKSCSFSKSLSVHTARIKIVIDRYNTTLN